MKLLIIDNYDSFTYNIVHAVRQLGVTPTVKRNDELSLDEVAGYDKIIISPGPGIPSEAGLVPKILARYASEKPLLGICLGHQAIGEHFGAKLRNLTQVYHGIKSTVTVTAPDYLFDGLGESFDVGRYHSWVVDGKELPESLEVTAVSTDGEIMALRHRIFDVRGVQFHPESILTPDGMRIISNWINH
ncbi:MAG: aminodeoxychorismate/anthranilate synthase component II [Candidatus Amulumruptor caecigallinarius]|nr:aminodeoxychorismate/anthranilate synthase component II [Candidatus Amulumruptor caecigallinarius]MCM1397276.1 aminodeoxychorismate/anthranilate synthase component II [Candidatus Amulumruptor caecigallinarius]MCM1453659.1 aminodeoxychorismate/anthranilate synthase component II [bacterium]